MFIDTHCHLDCAPLCQRLPEVLAAARRAGVGRFIVPGVGPEGWAAIVRLGGEHPGVFPAVGLHPLQAAEYSAALLEQLATQARGAVAIGEIGLDYLVAGVSRERQQAAFRAQLQLAVRLGLPVLLHCRRAYQDLLRILREERVERVGGVMHAFSGSPETARECLRLGLAIGVAGTVTFRNAVRPLAVVREIPLEHLLLETDAPDLTPEPFRGQDNEPSFLPAIACTVAALKGVSLADVAVATSRTAERIFRI